MTKNYSKLYHFSVGLMNADPQVGCKIGVLVSDLCSHGLLRKISNGQMNCVSERHRSCEVRLEGRRKAEDHP